MRDRLRKVLTIAHLWRDSARENLGRIEGLVQALHGQKQEVKRLNEQLDRLGRFRVEPGNRTKQVWFEISERLAVEDPDMARKFFEDLIGRSLGKLLDPKPLRTHEKALLLCGPYSGRIVRHDQFAPIFVGGSDRTLAHSYYPTGIVADGMRVFLWEKAPRDVPVTTLLVREFVGKCLEARGLGEE